MFYMEALVSTATNRLRRVGIGGLAAAVVVGGLSLTAGPALADWAATGGQIGLVDTSPTAAPTNGATLVYSGKSAQAAGSIQLLIPNTFKNNDTIDLTLFDRGLAAGNVPGDICADSAHALGFSSAPTVTVDAVPKAPAAVLTATAPQPALAAATVAPVATTPPVFNVALTSSTRCTGLGTDIARLSINGVQAGGDPTNKWLVTISNIKYTLGSAVAPGQIEVVPFAFNGTPGSSASSRSPLFGGNLADDPTTPGFDATISTYTVNAFVAPVTFGATNGNLLADGTIQSLGDFTIGETVPYALQAGTYTLTLNGANFDTALPAPTVTASGNGSLETVTFNSVTVSTVTFTVGGTVDNTKALAITIKGLRASTGTQGSLTYTLAGGSVGQWLATPPGPAVTGVPAPLPGNLAAIAGAFQADIAAPALVANFTAADTSKRIGGLDRYQTAAKIAAYNGCNTSIVLASGQNFPDALAANYLASRFGGSILLTAQNSLPAATADAIRQLGAQTVYVIGGTGAISESVVNILRNTKQYECGGTVTTGQGNLQVIRIGGADRYATANAVNQTAAALGGNPVGRVQTKFGQSSKLTAVVASGENYPDALAAGPMVVAGANNTTGGPLPLILTTSGSLSPSAVSTINALGIQQVIIVGGTGAVSSTVETALQGLGLTTIRLAGADRYETATAIADFEYAGSPTASTTGTYDGGLGFTGQTAYLATGQLFPDALAGGTLAGYDQSPILLTTTASLSAATGTWLTANATQIDTVIAFGLGGAVSQAALDAANVAAA